MLRQLDFVGLGLPDRLELIGTCGFRARSIRRSRWAGRAPSTVPEPPSAPEINGADIVLNYGDPTPPRPIGDRLSMNGGSEIPDPRIDSPEERAEEQIEIAYDNA